jgi:hypothetical protein
MKEKWNKVGLGLVLVAAALLWVGALDAGEVVCADGACGEEAQAEGFDASTAGDRFAQAHEDGVEGSAPPLDSAFPVPLSSTLTIVDGNQSKPPSIPASPVFFAFVLSFRRAQPPRQLTGALCWWWTTPPRAGASSSPVGASPS